LIFVKININARFMIIFYFTATGNSLDVAKELGGELISIPKVMRSDQRKFEADVIGFVFPVHYGKVPDIVYDFIQQMDLTTNYSFLIAY